MYKDPWTKSKGSRIKGEIGGCCGGGESWWGEMETTVLEKQLKNLKKIKTSLGKWKHTSKKI